MFLMYHILNLHDIPIKQQPVRDQKLPRLFIFTFPPIASNGLHRNHRHIRSVRIQPIPTVSGRDTVDNNGGHAQPKNNGHNGHIIPASSRNNNNNPRPRVHYETRAKRFFNRLRRVSRRVHFIRRLSRRIRRDQIGPPLQPRIAVNPAMRPIGK